MDVDRRVDADKWMLLLLNGNNIWMSVFTFSLYLLVVLKVCSVEEDDVS